MMSREARLLADCEDALFRLALLRLEARRADALIGEANAGDADLTPEEMDRTFERAWPRILRRVRWESRRAGLRTFRRGTLSRVATVAAAVLAVALIGGISALAVSPGMRASLSRLLVDPQPKFTDFRMSDDVAYLEPVVPDGFEGDFYPSYIPAGFSPAGANRGHAYYLTADEQRVLYYNEYDENTVLGLDTEDADVTYTKVGGTDAMLVQKNGLSSVVWSFANRFFLVSLTGSPEEAMKIAESLVLID
jgi:hypothetical protein